MGEEKDSLVIGSNESSFTLDVWRTSAQAYGRDCLLPSVKHGGVSVMIWVDVPWFSAGPIVNLKGIITGEKYRETLTDQVHPIMKPLLPAGDNAPIHASRLVQSWFDKQKDEVKDLP
ncbi:DDE_3 domain-containing protein [Trichonephila clavipes]|nr:DDE_3 domain-containing protein [Trichonephila clavipes]